MTLRSVIYARQSLDRSGEGAAVDRQVADCRALAKAKGWDVVEVISDNDMSASSGKVRPGYQRVLQMIEAGAVDRVVVWAVDRLTRRMRDLEDVVDVCERTGVRVATVTGELDLSTDTGRLLARILAAVARGEVERKGARQRAANLQRAKQGNVGWTRRPFGYERHDGRVVVVEDEADALRWAAQQVLDGGTVAAAARGLEAVGLHPTAEVRHGCPRDSRCGRPAKECPSQLPAQWSTTSLRRALLNPRYAGKAVSKGEDHGRGAWPIIIDAEVQERLSQVLRDPQRRTQQDTTAKWLLSGLLTCGRCGRTMYASPMRSKGRSWMVYRCPTTHLMRRLDLVDEVVVGVILARLAMPDAVDLFRPDVDLDRLRGEATDLRKRRDDLAELLAEGLLSPAKVREQSARVGERLRAVEAQIATTGAGDPVAALAGAVDVEAVWSSLSLVQRRGVVRALVDVTIQPSGKGVPFDPEHVEIKWRQS